MVQHNNTFKIKDMRALFLGALGQVIIEDWNLCTNPCDILQEKDCIKEGIRNETLQHIVHNLQDNSDNLSQSELQDQFSWFF